VTAKEGCERSGRQAPRSSALRDER
jgi:hypothetical protein